MIHFPVRGQRWKLVRVSAFADPSQAGEACSQTRTLRVLARNRISDAEAMRVVIHEMLHAFGWSKSEKAVDEASTAIRDVLSRLGYERRPE